METEIVKINDTTVAQMRAVRSIWGSTDLAKKKAALEEQIAEVNELIAALE